MMYIGAGAFLVSIGMVSMLEIFAQRNAFRLKILYFKSILEKDSGWFDENIPSELTASIAKQTTAILRGTG